MRAAIFVSVVCGLLAALPANVAAEPEATAVPGISSAGEAIVRGADGAMWIAEPADPGAIARVTAAGVVTELRGGVAHNFHADQNPNGLTAAGEEIWFIADDGEDLGRITTGGNIVRYPLHHSRATSLAGGPDGRLWLTVESDPGDPDKLARVDSNISVTTFDLPANSNPRSITAGPDGALWFVEHGGAGRLGRITTSGELSWRNVNGAPAAIATGPLSSLWFARGASVFRLDDPATYSTGAATEALALGPDGALWGAMVGGVARIEPGSVPTMHSTGVPSGAHGMGIAAGPDGRMWMTLDRSPFLVRITVPPRVESIRAVPDAATATVMAEVNPNGVDTEVDAELRRPDGTWQSAGSVNAGAGTAAFPVTLALHGLTGGRAQLVRVRATNAAGSAVSSGVELAIPRTPDPPPPEPSGQPPEPVSTPPVAPLEVAPVPVEGKSVVLSAAAGTVRIKAPGQAGYTTLDSTSNVPVGSLIDTTSGSVVLSSRAGGKTQSGTFSGGKFRVRHGRGGMTALTLAGELDCQPRRTQAAAAAAAKPKPKRKPKKKRRVWGEDDGGRFQTHGQSSVATVRGTRWLTEDTCSGTRVRVAEGAVSVKPAGQRVVLLRAGDSLFTRHRR